MIYAFDTYYYENKANTVAVGFKSWSDEKPIEVYSEVLEGILEYEPGSFYKRELPCILSVLEKIDLTGIELIIIDGYVQLDDNGKLGLGGHLYKRLDEKIPIIGVAKSGYRQNKINNKILLRGKSKNPLYISAIGIELNKAFEYIKSMHGKYRMPTLLQLLDGKTKEKTVGNIV